MIIYKLETLEGFDYDEYDAFVVAATSHEEARILAVAAANSWGRTVGRWIDPARSSCAQIGVTTDSAASCVILGSFNAG